MIFLALRKAAEGIPERQALFSSAGFKLGLRELLYTPGGCQAGVILL